MKGRRLHQIEDSSQKVLNMWKEILKSREDIDSMTCSANYSLTWSGVDTGGSIQDFSEEPFTKSHWPYISHTHPKNLYCHWSSWLQTNRLIYKLLTKILPKRIAKVFGELIYPYQIAFIKWFILASMHHIGSYLMTIWHHIGSFGRLNKTRLWKEDSTYK